MTMPTLRAILLAGGAARRLGGADKAQLKRRGRPLIQHWSTAFAQYGISGVVVGPGNLHPDLPEGFMLTREDPPLAGPAAAVCAGAEALSLPSRTQTDWQHVFLLAVDIAEPAALLDWLIPHTEAIYLGKVEAVIPQDATGRAQYLAAIVDAEWLSRRINQLAVEERRGLPIRQLLSGAEALAPQMPAELGRDVDTADDAAALDVTLPTNPEESFT